MPDLWMPGVTRAEPTDQTPIPLGLQGEGLRLFTWHTFEAPYTYSPDGIAAARYLNAQRSTPHFVLHPTTGALVQLLPADVGARTLRADGPARHTNAHGAVHMQVEVIGQAARPFTADLTDAGRATLARLLDFLRSWGIPDQWAWTNQRPPAYPGPGVARRAPDRSGHAYHSGWWANDHGDPGQIAAPWTLTPAPQEPPVSKRTPTAADFVNLENRLRARGFAIYCGPSFVASGACRPIVAGQPGGHGHMPGSRHFAKPGYAVDFGWPGAAVSDLEALHVELMMDELRADPQIAWRGIWNLGPGDHQDHGHVDDRYYATGYFFVVKPRPGVRARDGVDLFVSVKAFPNHVPPTNAGYTLAWIAARQRELTILGYAPGTADGYLGSKTRAAVKAFQKAAGLEPDELPGRDTAAALKTALAARSTPAPQPAPKPAPTPAPAPAPQPAPQPAPLVDPPGRIAGESRYHTAAQTALAAPLEQQDHVYLACADPHYDATAIAKNGAPGVLLYVRAGNDTLPAPTLDAITRLRPKKVTAVGGADVVTIAAVHAARIAAGIPTPTK